MKSTEKISKTREKQHVSRAESDSVAVLRESILSGSLDQLRVFITSYRNFLDFGSDDETDAIRFFRDANAEDLLDFAKIVAREDALECTLEEDVILYLARNEEARKEALQLLQQESIDLVVFDKFKSKESEFITVDKINFFGKVIKRMLVTSFAEVFVQDLQNQWWSLSSATSVLTAVSEETTTAAVEYALQRKALNR